MKKIEFTFYDAEEGLYYALYTIVLFFVRYGEFFFPQNKYARALCKSGV